MRRELFDEHLRERYFRWLVAQTLPSDIQNHGQYDELLGYLYDKEFVFVVPKDENRLEDAFELRHIAFEEMHQQPLRRMESIGVVSFLEVIVAMSRRMSFLMDDPAPTWAWYLLSTLGLNRFKGRVGVVRRHHIDEIVDRVIWRSYAYSGEGGFFPLSHPKQDQRDVELWYQMNAYIGELLDG